MRRVRLTMVLLLCSSLLPAAFCAPLSLLPASLYERAPSAGRSTPSAGRSTPSAGRSTAQWTVMVYLDGDNDLEDCAITDFNEMEAVGSTSAVNVLVQFDRAAGYDTSNGDWTECRRYRVTQDSNTSTISSAVLQNLGEVDMGAGSTLSSFIAWCQTNYPATHYALILWDHGGGWRSPAKGSSKGVGVRRAATRDGGKAVCWDGNTSCLYTKEWATVVGAASSPIELLGFDTCLAGMIEPAYEARVTGGASAMVASAATVPVDGFPYDTVLAALTGTPTMSALTLSDTIAECYEDYYSDQTIGSYDLSQIPAVLSATNSFATAVQSAGVWPALAAARGSAQSYDDCYLDLRGIVEGVRDDPTANAVRTQASALADALGSLVRRYYGGTSYPNGLGISASFPTTGVESEYTNAVIAWVGASTWDELVDAYAAADKVAPTTPVLSAIDNSDLDGAYDLSWTAASDSAGIAGYYVQEYAAPTTSLSDGAESASSTWSLSGFSRSTARSCAGSYSYYSGQGDELTSRMTMASRLALPSSRPILDFWTWYNTESGYDFGYVWISTNSGSTWTKLAKFTGSSGGWVHLQLDLSTYAGLSAQIRFSYETDTSVTYTGVYLDQVQILDLPLSGAQWSTGSSTRTLSVSGRATGTWGYCVRAVDGSGNAGAYSGLQTVAVSGEPPSAPTTVTISPGAPDSGDDLTATASGSAEATSYVYQWARRSGSTDTWSSWDWSGATLAATETSAGQQWKARARAASAGGYSDWVQSSAVTISSARPTAAATLTVTPRVPRTGDTLVAKAAGYSDPDGDTVTCQYQWCRSTDGGATWSGWDWGGRTIEGTEVARGQRWQVRMRARDSIGPGPWTISAQLVVRNALPTAPTVVAIRPAAPAAGQQLTASAGGSTDADGDSLSYVYAWSVSTDGGATWGSWGNAGKVLAGSSTVAGQRWRVRARASDGSARGAWTTSEAVTVRRAVSGAMALTMIPQATSGRSVQITCVLSQAATVEGRVLNLAGRGIANLSARALPAGSSSLLWAARADSGLTLPNGTYIIELQARTADGEYVVRRGTVILTR